MPSTTSRAAYSVAPQNSLEIDGPNMALHRDAEEDHFVDDDHQVLENGLNGPGHTHGTLPPWSPSGNKWKDFWFFSGPGWLLSIAYVDPGNYQADIQAGATTGYKLLWTIWWTTILSIYVQRMCIRLAYLGQVTLAEVQARDYIDVPWFRYMNWFIAEVSAVLTDLPEVIGIGIAGKIFFGFPYYVGVLMSLLTTMVFLGSQKRYSLDFPIMWVF